MMKDENSRYILRATDFPAYNIWGFEWKLGKEKTQLVIPCLSSSIHIALAYNDATGTVLVAFSAHENRPCGTFK
ncbi:hypothetical protein ABE288_05400 [Bacillus salipaludis]|uniref:hypothetical protein n=1 Tax=Bacillus salipaludis TaxID=2547811 RepID=UPI003D1C30B5